MSPAFCDSLPSEFHHKALSSHETCHIMRSHYLFLLVYLLGSCFGKSRFCVFSLIYKHQRTNPLLKDKAGDILYFCYCQQISLKEQNQQGSDSKACFGLLLYSKNISGSHTIALGYMFLHCNELMP